MAPKPNAPKPLLRDLIHIKEHISTSDYVLGLVESVADPATFVQAVREYVITEQLLANYDQALALIKSALDGRASKPAYLHGSFGSGKSHFMAVLYALLSNDSAINSAARARKEFAPVLAKHEWLQTDGRRFLLVPYHMLGAKSLEQRVLGGYVEHVRAMDPNVHLPQVYRTDALFDSLAGMRARPGGDDFVLQALNSIYEGAEGDEWGDTIFWTADKLDTAMAAPESHEPGAALDLVEPKTPQELRAKLVGDASATLITGFTRDAAEDEHGFISLDAGLSVIAEHAKSIGYDGLILFLDELVLWLHTQMHDHKFVARETGKMTNFREGGDTRRAIPIVSFIARQRDPRELLGGEASGAYAAAIHDNLELASGRFDVIELEDRNLPEIAHERLLKPLTKDGQAQIDAAFAVTKRVGPQVWDALLGSDQSTGADEASFKLAYPFSPAFLSTLVHMSTDLQRNRTGLKLMGELLAQRRDNLFLGQLVPLGDLYEVLTAGGDRPFVADKRVMFEAADRLYRNDLRPYLRRLYEVTEDDIDAYLHRPAEITDTKVVNGCKQFTADNQLLCTLLLSALAPSAPALHDLNARSLGALNHGSIATPIPGAEVGVIANKVREWAGQFAEIKYSEPDANPGVRLELTGVNVDMVLANASVNNTRANRAALAKRLLIGEFGIDPGTDVSNSHPLRFVWRGSNRTVEVVFGNVRDEDELPDNQLQPYDSSLWRLVIDLPFDEDDHTAREDATRVRELRAKQQDHPTQTVAWLPDHLSKARWDGFQKLVIIDKAIADRGRFDTQYASHLNADNRATAWNLLSTQRDTLMTQMRAAFKKAYGLDAKVETDVQNVFDDHLQPLPEIADLRLPFGSTMHDGIRHLAGVMLAHQYPAHPDFSDDIGSPVRSADAKTVFTHVRSAAETRDGRVEIPAKDRQIMQRIAVPLGLGEQKEAYFELSRRWADDFRRFATTDGVTGDLPVTTLAKWTDRPPRGLDEFLKNLVIAAFAAMDDRVWVRAGVSQDTLPEPSQLKPVDALGKQPLPSETIWDTARHRLEAITGNKAPALLRGPMVQHLARQLTTFARDFAEPAAALVRQLESHTTFLNLDSSDRLALAHRAAALLTAVSTANEGGSPTAKKTVEAFAGFDLGEATPQHLGASLKQARAVADALETAPWGTLRLYKRLGASGERLLESLRATARANQFTDDLVAKLTDTADAITTALDTEESTPALPGETQRSEDIDLSKESNHPPVHADTASRTPARSGSRRFSAVNARNAIGELEHEVADLARREPNARIVVTWEVIE
ncbi:phage resistance protein [Nocardia sp. XZ_19_385]|uniref:BREX-2 system ATPase PglY n=1 Tax=Nocardia sp. XZ_19_385 TaxID=2769488 RepID=UPI00188FE724|nr:phage resistance protein [Nocardia sp. XZ_19_385]